MNLEESVKDALQRRTDLQPDTDRVREAVNARTARTHKGMPRLALLAAGAAIVAAVSVVISVSVFSPPPANHQMGPPPSPTTSAKPTVPGPVMKYAPTWLPPGMTEFKRGHRPAHPTANSNAMMSRSWRLNSEWERVLMTVRQTTALTPVQNSTPTEVNGIPAVLISMGPDKVSVQWMATPTEEVSVNVELLPDVTGTAMRVARSVRSDAAVPMSPAMTFGWLPDGMQPQGYESSGPTRAEIFTTVSAARGYGIDRVSLYVAAARPPGFPPEQMKPVTVLGKQGSYADSKFYAEFAVKLDDTYWLRAVWDTTQSGLPLKDDLLRIVDSLTITDLTYQWYGQTGIPR
ncbi:hypothetical protein JOF56_004075 [Kibdelosporangium banguiense]|uniref:Uncharacterized protein n=1 Tax=Kibdelosporangium banguiense TaxID=1365924 RepID=A0ABS4TI49_9PSEU|nr:hypothetical protein [Kibdelosporangium banguiense]MBP2323690.1 hypothetical protein [Kibdelosporangium banguiense]